MSNAEPGKRSTSFYILIGAGLAVVVAAAVVGSRGLPGLYNTPTTVVDGRSVVGKTAN
jgi:hypothetical protein